MKNLIFAIAGLGPVMCGGPGEHPKHVRENPNKLDKDLGAVEKDFESLGVPEREPTWTHLMPPLTAGDFSKSTSQRFDEMRMRKSLTPVGEVAGKTIGDE